MPGIYITAILTTIVAAAIFGTLIHFLRLPARERLLWMAATLTLPLQPLVFYCLRMPLNHWLAAHLGSQSAGYTWWSTCSAPLTEEPAKLLVLLIPAVRRDIRPENFVRYALAIGVGFAIGEMWFIANGLAHNPAWARVPFYQFSGYAIERLMVCVFHSTFLAVTLWQLRRRFPLGLAGAMALHWLGNFPIWLKDWNVFGLGQAVWFSIVEGWTMLYFTAAIGLLCYLGFGRGTPPNEAVERMAAGAAVSPNRKPMAAAIVHRDRHL